MMISKIQDAAPRRILALALVACSLSLLSGCVRVPLSRAQAPIPEAPIDFNAIDPGAAISAITGTTPRRDDVADRDMLAMAEDRPLLPGEEKTLLAASGQRIRPAARRKHYRPQTLGYFNTARGFETPPIDPLGQVTMFDRPIYQR